MAAANLRLPEPLNMAGSNVADNWHRFRDQWENYELAADLTEASSEKRAAVFLTCIGSDAYDVYRSMEFDTVANKKKIDPIIQAFEVFCVGAVNVTYERYMFNRRIQERGERFDVFLGDVRRMARSCKFDAVEESMIRDRIVVGIHEDSTRHKLLQIRDLTLAKAIDICKASEAAGRQLKAMTAQDEVQSLQPSRRRSESKVRGRSKSRPNSNSAHGRDKSKARNGSCIYCGQKHERGKDKCPSYGHTCRICTKKTSFRVSLQVEGCWPKQYAARGL